MLTEEQIKNLKPGDTIYLNHYPLTFNDVGDDLNTISARDDASTCGEGGFCWFTRQYLTVKPKHDPCRMFKKGDMVQPRSGKTVLASEYGFVTFHELAGQYEVNEDEARGTVTLIVNGHACFVSAFALELVTPVEELEPYKLIDSPNTYNIVRDSAMVMTIHKKSHPNAKAAAEAECDRLNAEWIKSNHN